MNVYQKFRSWLEAKKLWEIFIYCFFGGLTTLVNIVAFSLAYRMFGWSWPISNTFSWVLSVLFAFVTNKLWVFHSKTDSFKELAWEFSKFLFARLLSFGLDMGCMFLMIDMLHTGDMLAKIVTQVFIVIANYIFSKLFIFTSKTEIIEERKEL